MKIIQRYLLVQLLRNLFLALLVFLMLFIITDFFDRIDNILKEDTDFFTVFKYFAFKIPQMLSYILPIATLVSVLFTLGLLSKNSEMTAMRASGLPLWWLSVPVIAIGLVLSISTIVFNETLVPYCTRRVKEIYNIDIRKKHLTGTYSQEDFWWRTGDTFRSVGMFDSRSNDLFGFTELELTDEGRILTRTDANKVVWLDSQLGWSMKGVTERNFKPGMPPQVDRHRNLPLTIRETPQDFYDVKRDPQTMSFLQLRKFIKKQKANGLPVSGYLSDLWAKISFPFVILVASFAVIPFALKPARTGSLASSFMLGLIIGFMYYAVHSFSLALGRAELWPPMLAAWMANLIMLFIGVILNLGAESPS